MYTWDIGMPSSVYSVSVAFGAPAHRHVTAGVDLRAVVGLSQGWGIGRLEGLHDRYDSVACVYPYDLAL